MYCTAVLRCTGNFVAPPTLVQVASRACTHACFCRCRCRCRCCTAAIPHTLLLFLHLHGHTASQHSNSPTCGSCIDNTQLRPHAFNRCFCFSFCTPMPTTMPLPPPIRVVACNYRIFLFLGINYPLCSARFNWFWFSFSWYLQTPPCPASLAWFGSFGLVSTTPPSLPHLPNFTPLPCSRP